MGLDLSLHNVAPHCRCFGRVHSDQHYIAVVECELSAAESPSYAIHAMTHRTHLT